MPTAVKTLGIREARSSLDRLVVRLRDLSWFWAEALQAFTERERRWFDAQGEGSWPPLSPTYAAWKAQAFPGQPLLVLSGDLRGQLTSPQKALMFESPSMLVIGSSLPYSGFLKDGTQKMPARDPLVPLERFAGGLIVRLKESLRLISMGGTGF